MKSVILLLLATPGIAFSELLPHPEPVPCEKEGKVVPSFVTSDKFTFTGAQLLAKYPDGLLFKIDRAAPPTNLPNAALQDCVVMISHEVLPESLRRAVGGFPAAKAEKAKNQRSAALESGNKEMFPKAVAGSWEVRWHPDGGGDPFGDVAGGKAQSWEEYEEAKAKAAAAKKEDAPRAKKDLGDLIGTKWVWGSGGDLELRKEGVAKHSRWEKPGTWERATDGTVILTNASGRRFTITIDGTGLGKVVGSDGKETSVYFKSKGRAGE